ncbi:hypothetical protein F5Y15DRAFT_54446 [Xylariaceae sp. FL0016]|nr:hypothetical protein F5Y15DRAFT_54446 [Xylariaceae sp. FL0016]
MAATFQPLPTVVTPSYPPPPDSRLQRPGTGPRPLPVATHSIFEGADIRSIKGATEFSLREYATLQKRQRPGDPVAEDRLRAQAGIVLSDLQVLRREVGALVKEAERHRWRKWVLGGVVGSLIPFIRRLFRRSSKEDRDASSTDTEHAFRQSKSLIARILSSVRGKGRLASVAVFVLSALYVFQAEVALRVARTMAKRLKRLAGKVERGAEALTDDDLRLLNGWRWRVLLW